jgi:hypothetical protein
MSVYCCCCCLFRYPISPETFGYTFVFGPKKEKDAEGWRRVHKEELHNLCISPDIIRMIKSITSITNILNTPVEKR